MLVCLPLFILKICLARRQSPTYRLFAFEDYALFILELRLLSDTFNYSTKKIQDWSPFLSNQIYPPCKGLAKLGNIVAETRFLAMLPGVAKLGNICFGRKICVREAKMFLTPGKNIFCFPSNKNLFPEHMFTARLNWETFASATMFSQQCFLV